MLEASLLRVGRYRVAEELFTLGYAKNCGPFGCDATCCRHGAYIDLSERDRILEHRELVKRVMSDDQPRNEAEWFEHEERLDADYPSGRCIGTTERSRGCVFLDRNGRCSLQIAAVESGRPKWVLKPRYCSLFPIDIRGDLITFDARLQNQRPCCSSASAFEVPLFRACHEELSDLLGSDGFAKIERHYREHYARESELLERR